MARTRRGRGEGSVYWSEAHGRFEAALTTGYDEQGRRKRRVVTGPTKAEVVRRLAELRSRVVGGTLTEPNTLTVGAYLDQWVNARASGDRALRPTTADRYRDVIRLHIKPLVGGVRLTGLTPVHVDGLLSAIRKPRTAGIVYEILHAAMRRAVKLRLLPLNPVEAVEKPRRTDKRLAPWTPEQVRAFWATSRGDRLHALYVLAAGDGPRQGEALGLTWGQLDLRARTVRYDRQLCELRGRLWIGEQKTPASRRTNTLPRAVVEALLEHRSRALAERGLAAVRPDAPVFTSPRGHLIRKSALRRRSWLPLLKSAGLPKIRFHDLRHTAASILLAEGVPVKAVSAHLGHSETRTTTETYAHLLPGADQQAADAMDRALDGCPLAVSGASGGKDGDASG